MRNESKNIFPQVASGGAVHDFFGWLSLYVALAQFLLTIQCCVAHQLMYVPQSNKVPMQGGFCERLAQREMKIVYKKLSCTLLDCSGAYAHFAKGGSIL